MHQQARITVGFPEFQDKVVGEFPSFFATLPKLQTALNELTTRVTHQSVRKIT